jgi:AcrR family transcriptional regulator
MKSLISNIQIQVQHSLYLKDPLSSELGKKIIKGSIELICELGFEQFTFKKLAVKIASTEASVYRYFESKNKVLLYLTNWYWSWLEYRLVFAITNVPSAYDQLSKAVYLLTEDGTEDGNFQHIDEGKLHKIVLSESLKSFLTKDVDSDNEGGAFAPYKNLVQRISTIILQINPDYKYPHMLVSTVVEGAHIQRHFANHLPRLTDVVEGEDAVAEFYSQIVFKAIK